VLDKGLACKEVRGADRAGLAGGEALVGVCLLEVLLDASQAVLAAKALGKGTGELLARKALLALAQGENALEPEAERGSGAHGRVIGRGARFFRGRSRVSGGSLRRGGPIPRRCRAYGPECM
jgi:hypothetical protein